MAPARGSRLNPTSTNDVSRRLSPDPLFGCCFSDSVCLDSFSRQRASYLKSRSLLTPLIVQHEELRTSDALSQPTIRQRIPFQTQPVTYTRHRRAPCKTFLSAFVRSTLAARRHTWQNPGQAAASLKRSQRYQMRILRLNQTPQSHRHLWTQRREFEEREFKSR